MHLLDSGLLQTVRLSGLEARSLKASSWQTQLLLGDSRRFCHSFDPWLPEPASSVCRAVDEGASLSLPPSPHLVRVRASQPLNSGLRSSNAYGCGLTDSKIVKVVT